MSNSKIDKGNIGKLCISVGVWLIYIIWVLKVASTDLTVTNFLLHLVFLGIIVLIYFNDIKKYISDYKKDGKKGIKSVLIYTLILFGILVVSNILISIISGMMGSSFDADSGSKAIGVLFSQAPWGTLFATFLTVIFYSIVEEFVFRKSIRDVVKNPILFVVISSLITWYFQATIFSPKLSEFVISLSVLFNSVFASIVYVKRGNILYTIFPRMIYNLIICGIQLVHLLTK